MMPVIHMGRYRFLCSPNEWAAIQYFPGWSFMGFYGIFGHEAHIKLVEEEC